MEMMHILQLGTLISGSGRIELDADCDGFLDLVIEQKGLFDCFE